MERLVTGLFYEPAEAPRAVQALKAAGISPECIYLEREIAPAGAADRQGSTVSRAERERRFAGLEAGIIIGLGIGLLAGGGIAMMSEGMAAVVRASTDSAPGGLLGASPWMLVLGATLLGAITGGLIGWIVDSTLDRLGAGPARPMEETLVTVRADDASLDRVYSALFRARARHLHVADGFGS